MLLKGRLLKEGRLARPVFDEPTGIVSDRHGNLPGRQDNFQKQLFEEFLWWAFAAGIKDLIDDGDTYDLKESADLLGILAATRHVEATLALRFNRIVVAGNHDASLLGKYWGVLPCPVVRRIETDDVFISHGNELDPACGGAGAWIGSLAARFWGALEKLGLGPSLQRVADWVTRHERRGLTASGRKDDNEIWIQDAIRRGKVLDVSGHSHLPELFELPGRPGHWYANPGSWVEPGKGYAIIVQGANVALWEFSN